MSLAHLRTDAQMFNLADAARSRSEADWLVRINGTRHDRLTRVTVAFPDRWVACKPTRPSWLSAKRIRKFISRDYWEVHAEFICAQGVYNGRWFDPKFDKNAKEI